MDARLRRGAALELVSRTRWDARAVRRTRSGDAGDFSATDGDVVRGWRRRDGVETVRRRVFARTPGDASTRFSRRRRVRLVSRRRERRRHRYLRSVIDAAVLRVRVHHSSQRRGIIRRRRSTRALPRRVARNGPRRLRRARVRRGEDRGVDHHVLRRIDASTDRDRSRVVVIGRIIRRRAPTRRRPLRRAVRRVVHRRRHRRRLARVISSIRARTDSFISIHRDLPYFRAPLSLSLSPLTPRLVTRRRRRS